MSGDAVKPASGEAVKPAKGDSAAPAPGTGSLPANLPGPSLSPAQPAMPSGGSRPAAQATPRTLESAAKEEPQHAEVVREKIFENWPKPDLALVITGRQDGYIEPCGCAGMDRMKGGLSRRHTFFRQCRDLGWPVVAVDVGGNSAGDVRGYGRQAQLKFRAVVEAMKIMGYDAIALGTNELKLPADELLSNIAPVGQQPSPFVSANVGLFGFDPNLTPQKQVIQRGRFKVGVTSILGETYQRQITNPEIVKADPQEALAKIVPELKKQCNLLILLAHATVKESTELANKFPEFDVVVTSEPAGDPPRALQHVQGGKAVFVEVGDKGMNAVVLGFYPGNEIRYQRVPLDARFKASDEMKKVMREYQLHLEQLGLSGLGVKPMPHPSVETMGTFVGSEKCKSCHEKSYDVWKKSGHAKAYTTLTTRDPPRQFDPECVSCHVVGWHPQQFFPYQGGFESIKTTPQLAHVGCEACHGPGELHVKAEMGGNQALQEKHQKLVRLTKEEAEKHFCFSTCHDGDNSPAFQFKTYWPKVEHKEKE